MPMPKIEDWKAPWEKEGASEFDAAEARKYVYNVQVEREREKDAHTATKGELDTVKGERDTLAVKVTALEADTSVDDLKRENAALKAAAEEAQQNSRKVMLDAVKQEFGLTDKQVKKLEGNDLEALRLDAKETFGDPAPSGESEGGTGEQETGGTPASAPRRLHNAGNPGDEDKGKGPSKDEVLASIPD